VKGAIDREDVNVILGGVFDVNATLSRIDKNIQLIAMWLKEDDDEEEADDPRDPFS